MSMPDRDLARPEDKDPEAGARQAAYRLLLAEAERAMNEGDTTRFDDVLRQIFNEVRQEPGLPNPSLSLDVEMAEREAARDSRMDLYRIFTAILLVTALFASVVWALTQGGENGQANAQYVSLISGLAGIAIGWLYGSSGSQRRLSRTTVSESDSK